MDRVKIIRLCGVLGLALSVVLAITAVWGYHAYRASFGNLETPIKDTIVAAANAVGEMARTAQSGSNLADGLLVTLQSARKTVQDARESSIRQAKSLPQYANGVRVAADSMNRAAEGMRNSGAKIDVYVPPLGRPFVDAARALYELATSTSTVSTMLYNVSRSIETDAAATTGSFTDLCEQTLKLISDAERATATVRGQNLPQAVALMEKAAATLQQAGGQLEQAQWVGVALLVFGLALTATCAVLSIGLLVTGEALAKGAILKVA